jgi:3(or 17)beta-hydroxysteroid dehydrogenase
MPTASLAQKTAIVTGAASGIGAATARRFVAEGARVVLTDMDESGAELAAELAKKGTAKFVAHDVVDEAGWARVIATAEETFGPLDVLVNNAGIATAGRIEDLTLEVFRKTITVNLEGVFLGTKHAVAAMRKHKRAGSIVNVSSAMGLVGAPGASAYCASKGGVRLFTKAIALEVAKEGIRVNSVHPGGVKTAIWRKQSWWSSVVERAGSEEAAFQAIVGPTPQGRLADPDEIAEAIAYLASDGARFVTGSELVIDGGLTAM